MRNAIAKHLSELFNQGKAEYTLQWITFSVDDEKWLQVGRLGENHETTVLNMSHNDTQIEQISEIFKAYNQVAINVSPEESLEFHIEIDTDVLSALLEQLVNDIYSIGDFNDLEISQGNSGEVLADQPQSEYEQLREMHFEYARKIHELYRRRDEDPQILGEVIETCKKQIEIAPRVRNAFRQEHIERLEWLINHSPPELRKECENKLYDVKTLDVWPCPHHSGFERLIILEAGKGNFASAINLCRQAEEQGWPGDWSKRIERYTKKLHSA